MPGAFSYRGDEVAAQAATGAVRYDIRHDPARDRWYLDASWKAAPVPAPSLDDLRQAPVLAVDVNHGHLAVAAVAPDGNILGAPATIGLDLAGLPATTRDGRLRAAITTLIATAKEHGARAIVIEDLDFAAARAEGRERAGSRPSRGRRGRAFRRLVSGIPAGKFRDRLAQMAANAGLSVIVVDPAYTSRWGTEHWLRPLREHHPKATGHHAAALVTGRRGLGHRARRRATGNRTAPEEAARPAQARTRTTPSARGRTQETRRPTRPPAPTRRQDRQASPDHGRQPGSPRPFGAAGQTGPSPASSTGTVMAPDMIEYPASTEDAAGVQHEEPQQPELGGRQRDEDAVPPDFVAVFVEFQAGDAYPRGRRGTAGAPQHGPDAFQHLVQAERLGHVVVCAEGQAGDTLADTVASAQEDDRNARAVRPHPAHHLEPVAVRHHHVEQD